MQKLLTYPSFITGDIIQYQGEPHILRSVNFVTGKATLEQITSFYPYTGTGYTFGRFAIVSMGAQRKFLDLREFESVLNRKIDYAMERIILKGKFKVSKEHLARLQSQRNGLLGITEIPVAKKTRKSRKPLTLAA